MKQVRPTKIAVIVPSRSEALFDRNSKIVFGGGNIQMYQMAKEIGHCNNVECYTFIEDYETIDFGEEDDFRIVKTYKNTDHILKKFWKYHKCLQEIKPDTIMQHGLTLFSSLLAVYCKIFKIKYVYMFASDVEVEGRYQENKKKSPLFWLLINMAKVLITQNGHQKDQLLELFNKESHVVKNGFYLKSPLKPRGDFVLWVARHSDLKRPELYIQLASQNSQIRFVMVCPPSLASDYEMLVGKAKLVTNLEFVKFVPFDEIDDYFEQAKLFINTSEYEGFPQTFIQATMNSLPIVSLNVNPDYIISDYGLGFYCDNDFGELNAKLGLLFADDALYQDMSRKAYLYAHKNHDIKKNVQQVLRLIDC